MSEAALAPGVPPDYYDRIAEVENRHWWYLGMRRIAEALIRDQLRRPGQRILDCGCGTGGFLRWALDSGSFAAAAGVDIGSAAIEMARARVPEADLRVGPLSDLPFPDGGFDLVVTNDVLQHVPEDEVAPSLREIRRVLAPGGTLLLRTNGARRLRRERADWRAYDRATLRAALLDAGLVNVHVTYANAALSLLAGLSRRTPHAPSETSHGIVAPEGRLKSTVGLAILTAEARWLAGGKRALPFGHTLFALGSAP
jgi:SAM-dependent methyltransferase